ncbi:MAG: hypothetical protein ACI4MI_04585 [Christensenellales bacterium]
MWESIKEFFGIETKKDKEEKAAKEQQKQELMESQSLLYDQLEALDQEWKNNSSNKYVLYEDTMPDTYEWTPMQYEGESEEDIINRINATYEPLKSQKTQAVTDEYDALVDAQNDKKTQAETKAQSDNLANEKDRDDNLDKIKGGSSDKGMVRSSVKTALDEEAQRTFEQMKAQIYDNYVNNVSAIDNKIEQLQAQRSEALSDLDLSFAKTISSEIDKLIKERNSELESIQKYNDEQSKKALEYIQKRTELIQKQKKEIADQQAKEREEELKNGYSGEKLDNYQERLDKAVAFYQAMPSDIAKELISNNQQLKSYLGLMYNKLVSAING